MTCAKVGVKEGTEQLNQTSRQTISFYASVLPDRLRQPQSGFHDEDESLTWS